MSTCGRCEGTADGLCDYHLLQQVLGNLSQNYYGEVVYDKEWQGYLIERDGEKITPNYSDKEKVEEIWEEIVEDLDYGYVKET